MTFSWQTKVLENTMTVLAKVTFSNLQVLKTRINGHDDDLDQLKKYFSPFLELTNQHFHKISMTLNNYHLAI